MKPKRSKLTFRRFLLYVLFGLTVITGTVHFFDLRKTDQQIQESFQEKGFYPIIRHASFGKRKMRWMELGHESKPVLVFIHGAPSSMSSWTHIVADTLLTDRAKIILVDRPGYGFSDFGKPECSVQEQARLIYNIIASYKQKGRPFIIVGSSYGGTVATRIAMDYPALADQIVLVSASVAPGEEKTPWLANLAVTPVIKYLSPKVGRVASAEKLSHRSELEAMLPFWDSIRCKVLILHGDDDRLIYYQNALFAKSQLHRAASVELRTLPGRGHGIPWSDPEWLKQQIVQLIAPIRNDSLIIH